MKIVFIKGILSGQTMEFNLPELTIGRDDGNVLRLRTVGVSRVHAVLKRKADNGWIISDQNSTNGVKVNGRRIQGESPVFDHDVITIAEQEFQLEELGENISKIEFQPIIVSGADLPGEIRQAEAAPGTVTQTMTQNLTHDSGAEQAKKDGDKLLEQLRSAGSALFDREKGVQKESRIPEKTEKKSGNSRQKRIRQLIALFLVIAIVAMVAAKLPGIFGRKTTLAGVAKADDPAANLTLYYERVCYDQQKKSAYRLEVLLEDDQLSCTLDDLYSQRHAKLVEKKVSEQYANELELLGRALSAPGFQALESKKSAVNPSAGNFSRLAVVVNGEVIDLKYPGDAAPQAYEEAVAALVAFLDKFGFSTITLSREEMEARGNEHFANAQYALENYVGDLSKLREAFLNYRAAITCFEQFYPPHPNLKKARQKLKEVTELRKRKLHELQQEFSRYARLNDVSGMSRVCQDIMSLTGERSQAYREASRQLIRLRSMEKKGARR